MNSSRKILLPILLFLALIPIGLTIDASLGFRSFLSSAAIYLVFALPGITWALKMGTGVRDNFGFTLASSAAGIAGSLVAIAVIGSLFHYYSLVLILAVPLCLTLAVHFATMHMDSTKQKLKTTFGAFDSNTLVIAIVLGAVLLFVYSTVGSNYADKVHYTAYFNADFFKHLALTQTMVLHGLPPQDPYSAGNPLFYYWLFYLIPASAHLLDAVFPGIPGSYTKILLSCTFVQTLGMLFLLNYACRCMGAGIRASTVAVMFVMASLSLDGLTSMLLFGSNFIPAMTLMNVESLDFTMLFGVKHRFAASGFFRLCLYIPQHQLAICFLAAWVILYSLRKNALGRGAMLLALPATSLFVGCIGYAVTGLGEGLRTLQEKRRTSVIPLICILLGLLIYVGLDMIEPKNATSLASHSAGPWWFRLQRIEMYPPQWLTTYGVSGVLGLWGTWYAARKKHWEPLLLVGVGAFTTIMSLLFIPPNQLGLNVEFKASFVTALGLTLGTALALSQIARMRRFKGLTVSAIAFFMLLGIPTTIHDIIWHSTHNPRVTVNISQKDWDALLWLRDNTSPDAVVQQWPEKDYISGGRGIWVPTFAGRTVRTCSRSTTSQAVREAAISFFTPGGSSESYICIYRTLKLNYIYLSRQLQPKKFNTLNTIYTRTGMKKVYDNGAVTIWKIPEPEKK